MDIAKLKQEAEAARENLIDSLGVKINPSRVADNIIAATIKQIALQAAEREAETKKYDPVELSRSMFASKEDYMEAIEKLTPIADDDWITRTGNEEAIVPFYEMVELKFYDGQRSGPGMLASSVDWASPQIIAYRIISPATTIVAVADGAWIQHGGSACPIPYAQNVQVKRRDEKFEDGTASMFYWEWSGKKLAESDPIAYRIISPAADRVSES